MGREIRRVPPTWQHPRHERGHADAGEYMSLYDEDFETAIVKWMQEANAWVAQVRAGETPELGWYPDDSDEEAWARANPYKSFVQWYSAPPDPESYRDVFTEEPTAYQIYENVSEGSPISPVFQTREELLAWCQQDHPSKYWPWQALSADAAEQFIEAGSAPSLSFSPTFGVVEGAQAFEYLGKSSEESRS